jgi:hypothetical protein
MPSTDISIGASAVISLMSLPQRRSRSLLSGARVAVRVAVLCRGCMGSRRTCFIDAGERNAVSCEPMVVAESTSGSTMRTRPRRGSTARLLMHSSRVLADLSYEEISLVLDVPVGTVRTWLHRAREVAQRVLTSEVDLSTLAESGADGNG